MDDDVKEVDYGHMTAWRAFMRRYEANFFDIFFYDRENLTETEIKAIVNKVASFFQLPAPLVHGHCESLAEIMMSKDAGKYELYYDWQMMKNAGINNKDALTMVLVHEMTHQLTFAMRFMIFENELWIQELVADMMAGAYSLLGGNVATGKYKYVLSEMPATMTHPDGKLRAKAVDRGLETVMKLMSQKRYHGLQDVVDSLPAFVYEHYEELIEDWEHVLTDDDEMETPRFFDKDTDVDALPNNCYESRVLRDYQNKLSRKNDNLIL